MYFGAQKICSKCVPNLYSPYVVAKLYPNTISSWVSELASYASAFFTEKVSRGLILDHLKYTRNDLLKILLKDTVSVLLYFPSKTEKVLLEKGNLGTLLDETYSHNMQNKVLKVACFPYSYAENVNSKHFT